MAIYTLQLTENTKPNGSPDGWTGQLKELPECITQGGSALQVHLRMREALALVLDDELAAQAADIVEEYLT